MLGSDAGPEGASGARGSAPPRRADFGVPLETKLYPPGLRKEWVERQDLIARLSDSNSRLILVDAPAGFGKTTLVAQWRARAVQERRFAWVSLDRGDNDPARLWRHVVGALQKAIPELDGASLWQRPQDVTGSLLPLLVNALAAVQDPVVLALDDYHLIKERACHEQLGFLLLHLPPQAQLVVITRADPPLPLARLRASGDLTEIRARELGFTPAQAASFVHAIAGAELSDSDAADVVERTEGWPAGLYMVALSLREHPAPDEFIRGFTGSNRFVVDFLTEEVLSRQPHHVRQFLTRTSILGRFTAPLCDAVSGTANAAKVLDLLERENLFLVPLDDDRLWFRYHQLFRQMLRSQLTRTEPDIVPELHRRASAWYRAEGDTEEAIRHALAAGDTRVAANLIAQNWHAFVFGGRTATVRGWMRSLCGEQDSVRRWLPVLEAGQHDGPLPDGMRSLQFSAALIRGSFGFDGIGPMRKWAAKAVELDDDPASPWHALPLGSLGWALYLSGAPGAATVLGQAMLNDAAAPAVRMLTLATSSRLATDEGRHAQAGELANAAQVIADRSGLANAPQGSSVWTALGAVHAYEGNQEAARAEFGKALELRRQWLGISPWESLDTLLRLAQFLIDTGEHAEAATYVAEARQMLASLPDGAQAQQARLDRLEQQLPDRPRTPKDPTGPLTEREEAVLRLLRSTLSLREIGQELFLSTNTIKTHTRAIYRKLGVTTRSEAVERAYEAGLLP